MRILFRKRIIEATTNTKSKAPTIFCDVPNGPRSLMENSQETEASTESNNLNQPSYHVHGKPFVISESSKSTLVNHTGSSKCFNGRKSPMSQLDEVSQSNSSFEEAEVIDCIQIRAEHLDEGFGNCNYNSTRASVTKTGNCASQSNKKEHTGPSLGHLAQLLKNTTVQTKICVTRRDQDLNETAAISTHRIVVHSEANNGAEIGIGSHGRNSQTTSSLLTNEKIREAKLEAERAVRNHKVFAVLGPYNRIRQSLRMRGWVEKFYRNYTQLPNQGDQMIVLRRTDHKLPMNNGEKGVEPEGYPAVGKETAGMDVEEEETEKSPPITSMVDGNVGETRIRPYEENNGYYEVMFWLYSLRSTRPRKLMNAL
ncbi:hypothetical protein FGIG_10254 [Fasciola gigantica]|uniref:Uncharacterized protein n=1 Tax=Fasciola gigantica TaxID=46835 RepID=A0A504YXN0_FASGI|nr:hypothetical protein FGIG_10254 [Fasciola gigantica]